MKISFTRYQKIGEILSALLILSLIIYVIASWNHIPEKIPTHFNFKGEIDSWGSKNTIFFDVGMTIGLYLLLTVVNFFTNIWNVPSAKKSPERAYKLCRDMLINLKIIIILNFSYITYCTVEQINMSAMLTIAFLILVLVVTFGYTVYILIKC